MRVAHDRQLEREDQAEQSSGLSNPTGKASESLAVLRDWWAVYGQIYRDDPTELLAVAFRETLKDVPAKVLHEACLRAQREAPQFRPSPGRVYEIAEAIMAKLQKGNRPKYLDEPPMPEEEREAAINDPLYQDLKRRITVLGKQKTL